MGGTYVGPSMTELPGWRVGILFALFSLITLIWGKGVKALDRHFRRKGKRGLRHVLRALQDELLALGVTSLVLVAFEKYLLLICVPCSGESCHWGCSEAETSSDAEASSECQLASDICGTGEEPSWSPAAIMQAHVLLFVIAVVHIAYSCTVMLLCLWKVARWRAYEEQCRDKVWGSIRYKSMPVPGGNPLMHFLQCLKSMFTESVNDDVYFGLRRLFVERMDVDPEFDFHGFLVESMEEELARIIGVNWLLWLIAIVWIMMPPESWVMVWMTGLAFLLMLVVGVKLESINNQLAVDAYHKYGLPPLNEEGAPSPLAVGLRSIKEGLHRMSPLPLLAHLGRKSAGAAGSAAAGSGTKHREQQRGEGSPRQQGQQARRGMAVPDGADGVAANGVVAVPDLEAQASTKHAQQQADGTAGAALAARGRQEPAAAAEPQSPRRGQRRGRGAAGVVGSDTESEFDPLSDEESEDEGACSREEQAGRPPTSSRLDSGSSQQQQQQEQQQSNGHLPSAFDGPAQQPWAGEAGAAAAGSGAAGGGYSRHSVLRRCCVGLLPGVSWQQCSGWCSRLFGGCAKRTGAGSAGDGTHSGLQRSKSFAKGYRGLDAATLFWFGRPRIILRCIQVVYFENSLALATFLFSLWQGVDFDWGRGQRSQWAIIVAMAVVDLALMVFSALFVLPVYAMTTAAGSHCPSSVIKAALKKGIRPDICRALQRLSMDPALAATACEVELPELPLPGEHQPQLQPPPGAEASFGHPIGSLGPHQHAGSGDLHLEILPHQGSAELAAGLAPAASLHPLEIPPQHPGYPALGRLFAGGAAAAAGGGSVDFGGAGFQAGPPSLGRLSLARSSMGGGRTWSDSPRASVPSLPLPDDSAAALQHDDENGDKSMTRLLGAMYQRQLQKYLQRSSAASLGRRSSTGLPGEHAEHGGTWFPEAEPSNRSMPAALAAQLGSVQQDPSLSLPSALHLRGRQAQRAQQRPSLAEVRGLFQAGSSVEGEQLHESAREGEIPAAASGVPRDASGFSQTPLYQAGSLSFSAGLPPRQ